MFAETVKIWFPENNFSMTKLCCYLRHIVHFGRFVGNFVGNLAVNFVGNFMENSKPQLILKLVCWFIRQTVQLQSTRYLLNI